MAPDELSALANDPRLNALERDGRPAFVVDADGEILWLGANAASVLDDSGLDASAKRVLARMADSGASGMVRLRLGAVGRLTPLAFHARPLSIGGGARLLALEGLSAAPRREVEQVPPAAANGAALQESSAAPDVAPRDIALEEGVEHTSAAAKSGPVGPFSFVFEIDAANRLTHLSPDLEAAVGPTATAALGQDWDEVATLLGLDPENAVAEALGRRGGWSDVKIAWPLGEGRRAPILLSALPMFDRGRSFVGFRGLGRSSGEPQASAEDVSSPTADEIETFEPEKTLEVDDQPSIAAPLFEPAPPSDGADDGASEKPAIALEPPAEPFRGNVVALRETSPQTAATLSSNEESAFDEIARRLKALGVRVSDEATPPPAIETAELAFAPSTVGAWTIDDVDGRAPTASRVDDLLRLLDRLPIGALVLRAGEIAYANRATLDMLGHGDLDSLKSRGAEALFAETLPRDDAAPATIGLIARDGLEIEVEARLAAIGWGGGPATLVSLKRAEGAIAAAHAAIERERETAAILDAATDGVLVLDGAGRILSINRSAEALFGFEGRDVIGSLFTLSLAPESRRIAFDCLDQIKATGATAAINDGREVLGLARQGGAIPLFLTISRISAAENDRFCAVLRDVTPWKKAEEELLAAKRQAERANAQKTEFLAKVSHEIRTPLNAIIGFADVMMEERFGPIGSSRYRDYLRDIHVSGEHLVGLVNDLLDITRIESGGLKLDPSPIDLNEIAQQAATLLQPQANRDHVIIRTSLARGLPQVMADRRSVRQILTNLASNAVRLSRPGGQVIVATALTEIGQAVIRVRDAGVGMTKQELARALEPFRPLGLADNDSGGNLGLPLTKALAEANDAGFALRSELGYGTLAEVTFPASRVLAV